MDPLLQVEDGTSCKSRLVEQRKCSKDWLIYLKDGSSEHRRMKSDSPESSCVSKISYGSKNIDPPYFDGFIKSEQRPHQQERPNSPECSCVSMRSDGSGDLPLVCGIHSKASDALKLYLKTKFHCLHEGTAHHKNPTLLNEIYTELYITDGGSNYNEIQQIEASCRRAGTEHTSIKCNDIFKPLPEQTFTPEKNIRTVLTKGDAGIGKTVSVQKFVLDWAEGKANQDIHLIFPLPFRELNLIMDQKLSLTDLLHNIFTETKEVAISNDELKFLFIFDGLDECCLPLDFQSNVRLCDVNKSASVDVLLTNLINGNLLPSALIWITSRPAAADRFSSECVDRVTEVRGFNDPQKDEYFRKRISDQILANEIITHLKSSRSLYIMCHIPVFCWISSTVLERLLSEAESGEIPKTLTQMYTHFLIIQANFKNEKDYDNSVTDEDMILNLGKLAFQQLMKSSLVFYEEDLRECGIDVTVALVYSGLCTQIFMEEFGLCQRKVYCFVHLSIQEHLGALYVHHSFTNHGMNVFHQITEPTHEVTNTQISVSDLHKRAVDEALKSKNGHLDLFLRFLLGFSLKSNQTLLQCLLTQTGEHLESREEIVKYIKKQIEEYTTPAKFINLFRCLNDLGDNTLEEQIQRYLNARALTTVKFSPLQWSAVVFVLLTSQNLKRFELKKYAWKTKCPQMVQVLQHLLPVVEASTSAQLDHCELTAKSCAPLAKALSSESSCLKELNMNGNKLQDEGAKLLSEGIQNPHCKLEILRLGDNGITDEGCAALASALISNPSHLKKLVLSNNNIGNSGIKLHDVLENPHCNLEILKLENCCISNESCAALAAALSSNPLYMKYLNLSRNNLGDSEVNLLFATLANPQCKLEILRLKECGLTYEGCAALALALRSNTHLKELDLSLNKLGDTGLKLLFDLPENPDFRLEALWLIGCNVTSEGCAALGSALISNFSYLKELNLSENKVGDSGVKLLSLALENPYCKLEALGLNDCDVTDEGCSALTSALKSKSSFLRKLHLCGNKLEDSAQELHALRTDPQWKLEKVNLNSIKGGSFSQSFDPEERPQ
ncbi:NACHT, LRR and PYD domains-containing protein 3-like [Xyrauchen texanus]|uniref:NACHT, LRR and PYD domains-containing protein 3-like n=1 Tax=Xyrauchen texanus TaxID=154827 RepID=UPI002241CE86|nr:NACHT, LRR and PYD domains-containing protein 3-like [Xyrauchen texanus]